VRKATAQDELRLDAMARHLKIASRYPEPRFTVEVTAACLERVSPIISKLLPCSGEDIAQGLGDHFCVTFEEVHDQEDADEIVDRYLIGKNELGFAQLHDELADGGVDALLFERMYADEHDRDRWVAVLNLLEGGAKGYWSRFHELVHRVAEPPQQILPLRRHQFEASNPVEFLIDSIAGELAFFEPAFRPLVERAAKKSRLNFDVVCQIRNCFAPTASLLATVKAVVKFWPSPAIALTAERRGRKGNPSDGVALRVTLQGSSSTAEPVGLKVFRNMRVPQGSPMFEAFDTGIDQDEHEHLGDWDTSTGESLEPIDVFTSAWRIRHQVYALMSA